MHINMCAEEVSESIFYLKPGAGHGHPFSDGMPLHILKVLYTLNHLLDETKTWAE